MAVYSNVVCTFCGCLCDDIEVEVHDNQITKVKKACAIGRNKIVHAQSNAPAPSIAGCEASIAETVDEAAQILRTARFPLVYGLSIRGRTAPPPQNAPSLAGVSVRIMRASL